MLGTIFNRELKALLQSFSSYVILSVYFFLSGLFFFSYLGNFNKLIRQRLAMPAAELAKLNLNVQVLEYYFHVQVILLIIFIPILAMKSFAEERNGNTWELFLTLPIKTGKIILAKFLASYVFILIMIVLGLFYPVFLCLTESLQSYSLIGGTLVCLLSAYAFLGVAFGCATNSDRQILSVLLSLSILLILYFSFSVASHSNGIVAEVISNISPLYHARDLIRGIISLSSITYFILLGTLGILVSKRFINYQFWR